MGYVQGESRGQVTLFPVSLDELIGPDHVCRVIAAFIGTLDLAALGFTKARAKATGRPPYDPADLLALYLYGYLNRVRSSRRLERECERNVEVMWLLNRMVPDHKTIAEFRRCNGPAVKRAGAAFVQLCVHVGLVRGQWVAVDGTKFQAVASPKAIVEPGEVEQRKRILEERISEYLEEVEAGDAQEAASPADPQAVRAALAELQRQQQALQQAVPGKRVVYVCPVGALLRRKQVLNKDKIVTYAATTKDCAACARKPECTKAQRRYVSRHLFEHALERIRVNATPEAMRLRRSTVEHPYAALKYRIFEKPRFLLRGLSGAAAEISLATLVYNLKRAMNAVGATTLMWHLRGA